MRSSAHLRGHREICGRARLHLRRRRVRRRRAGAIMINMNGARQVTGAQAENGNERILGSQKAAGEGEDEDGWILRDAVDAGPRFVERMHP
eukprot:3594935-Pyramimonas_sp.AAC.1